MKKLFIIILSAFFVFSFLSCENSLGTPPEHFFSFSIDGYDDSGATILIDYTLTNDGEADLENCKIQIGFDTTTGYVKYWTEGVDLDEGETYSIDDKNTTITRNLTDINDITVIAAGFDSAKSVSGSTVIYYSAE